MKRGRKAGQRILRPSAASPTSGVPLDFPRRDGCQAGIFSLWILEQEEEGLSGQVEPQLDSPHTQGLQNTPGSSPLSQI